MAITATTFINSALRLAGILAAGETPSADEATDALASFVSLLDSWTGQELILVSTRRVAIALSAGSQGPYTISGARPIKVMGASVSLANGLGFPVQVLGPQAFGLVEHSGDASAQTRAMMCDYALTSPAVFVAPTPTGASTLNLDVLVALGTVTSGGDDVSALFPPSYLKALRFNLACDLAGEYGRAVDPNVLRIAQSTKAQIAALNGSNRAGASEVAIPPIPQEIAS
jgi:hypothetical protein